MPLEMSPEQVKRVGPQPPRIYTLFLGESPPANGTFFYFGDSLLARYTREAFASAGRPTGSMAEFLDEFKSAGFYLEDLCREPVNSLSRVERRRARRDAEATLAGHIANARPEAIVVVMKSIAPNVRRSMKRAAVDCPLYELPFPAQSHQREYVELLAQWLPSLPCVPRDS